MEIRSDILLKCTEWITAIEKLSSIFAEHPHYDIYMLCLSIGIMYDKRIESIGDASMSVPRNVIRNNDNGQLDTMFQAAILTTRTEDLTEEKRLELAFGDATDFNKISFLTEFANFGVTKLVELIGSTDEESMENIKNFLVKSVEGTNFDIDDLPDDIYTIDGLK